MDFKYIRNFLNPKYKLETILLEIIRLSFFIIFFALTANSNLWRKLNDSKFLL